ncbi:hypothetical protein Mnod_2524 [Methylobacterium nodulans ORS 2060]|uniref:Uncharacterized protein n=1 Tax=Methylobacterium nodulans (strain LMG 21967 / CNCM I-2342 / ORS 2060) TaxID=460265 RepID=B8ICT2_METNO|nr:hypothetical protein Mnod_2524 [Methylobacterium nodulans ORS 2060]
MNTIRCIAGGRATAGAPAQHAGDARFVASTVNARQR